MRRGMLLGTALTGISLAQASPATELRAKPYEPSSQWVLDYADERCTLARNFGSGDDTILLRVDSFGYRSNFHMILAGRPVPHPTDTVVAPGGYRLSSDSESRDVGLLFGTLGKDSVPAVSFEMEFIPFAELPDQRRMSDEQKTAYRLRLEQPLPDDDRKIDSIRVAFGRGSPVELHLGNMAQPLAAMRACIDDLHKSWGIDPTVEKSLSRLAEPLPSTVRRVQQDYPGGALMKGLSAYVPVRILVNANGDATACVVQSEQADAEFKRAVCNNLSGKFKPALDAAGNPVASMYHTSVIYFVR